MDNNKQTFHVLLLHSIQIIVSEPIFKELFTSCFLLKKSWSVIIKNGLLSSTFLNFVLFRILYRNFLTFKFVNEILKTE